MGEQACPTPGQVVLCVHVPLRLPAGMVQVSPLQQSCDDWQAASSGWQASGAPQVCEVASQICEQQSAAAVQASPLALQVGPDGTWQANPAPEARQEVPAQQVASDVPLHVAPTGLQVETAAQVFCRASGVARTQGR